MLGCDAVIFDLDGTLIDTEASYRTAFMAAAAGFGMEVPAALYDRLVGVASPDRGDILRTAFGADIPLPAFFAAYYRHRDALLATAIPVRPGVPALLGALRLPMAVATSASRRTATAHLRRAGLDGYFTHVVTRDDVARGKPAPDAFLRAADLLGVPAARCIAVEDSVVGIAAARAAGMRVVTVGPAGVAPVLRELIAGTHANVLTLTGP